MNKDLNYLSQLAEELLANTDGPTEGAGFANTCATLVHDDVLMLKRVLAFCESPKVWMLTVDNVIDYVSQYEKAQLFFDYKKAKAEYDAIVEDNRYEFVLTHGFVIDETDRHFEAYEDGYFAKDHFVVSLREVEIL